MRASRAREHQCEMSKCDSALVRFPLPIYKCVVSREAVMERLLERLLVSDRDLHSLCDH